MILQEATVGGIIYLSDWVESEKEKPESEKVKFNYGVLTTRERVDLVHKTSNANGMPNGADVCISAIDRKGLKVENIYTQSGEKLDTVKKCLDYNGGSWMAYYLEMVGLEIWNRQSLSGEQIKN